MKWNNWSQGSLAAALSIGLAFGLSSCGTSNTIDYLFATSAQAPGKINAYEVDSITGVLTQISASPTAAGTNPVGLVASPNGQNLYVINHDDNTVQQFTISAGAKLAAKNKYTLPATGPVAVTINPAGTLLFVIETYAPGYSSGTPGPGALVVYPVGSDGSLGTAVTQAASAAAYYPLGNAPSAINVLANGTALYVTDQLAAAAPGCQAGQGGLVALSIASSGALAPISGSPYCAGVTPSSVASHPLSSFVYVTDSSQNQLIGYHVNNDQSLVPFVGGPIPTGTFPDSVTVEPRGLYLYVANRFNDSAGLQSYSIAAGSGIPSSTGTYGTGTFPACVIVEPALARFVYTADFEGIGITGYKLDPNTGQLTGTQNSPYPAGGLATCVAAVSHGNHPQIHIQNTAGN